MRFLANENFPYPSIKILRDEGYFVKSIAEEMPGIKDNEVIAIAQREKLIVLTFDKDYGELIFRYGMKDPPAITFFRDKGYGPAFAGDFLLSVLSDETKELHDNFTIIEQNSIRQRKYIK